jgi:hypothetical protein
LLGGHLVAYTSRDDARDLDRDGRVAHRDRIEERLRSIVSVEQ